MKEIYWDDLNKFLRYRDRLNLDVLSQRMKDGNIELIMDHQNKVITTKISPFNDLWTSMLKDFVDFPIESGTVELRTPNMADNLTWLIGTDNSLYLIAPDINKKLLIRRFLGKLDKDITINTGQDFMVVLFESPDQKLPIPSNLFTVNQATDFTNMSNGWYDSGEPDSAQEVHVWVHFTGSVWDCKVTAFSFKSLFDMRAKSKDYVDGNLLSIEFDYITNNINKCLRYSLNERLEIYIKNNTAYTAQNEPCVLSVMMDSYDEWIEL